MTETRQAFRFILCAGVLAFVAGVANAESWREDLDEFDYTFGNHIDSHQKSRLLRNGDLMGALFIRYTGEYSSEGQPIAVHCDEHTAAKDCVVGWKMRGKPGMATFLYHHMDHPVWLVHSRGDIPQPGAFAHFHWISPSMAMDAQDHGTACAALSPMDLVPGTMCPGFFLELRAVRTFVFRHHMSEVLVTPGLDIATHMNIVTSHPPMDDAGGGHTH